jgi:hypothetical protein
MPTRRAPVLFLIAGLVGSSLMTLPDGANAQTPVTSGVRVTAPGYLNIDGRWYIFSGPSFMPNLEAFPLGNGQGFDFNAWATASSCAPNPPNPAPPNVPPYFRLREGQTTNAYFPMARLPQGGSEIRIGYCDGINLIAIRSASGRMVCAGEILNPPFNTATCPVIQRLIGGPSDLVFRDGFESGS